MKRLVLMLQFLTRLPLPFEVPAEQEDFQKGVIYFPVAGMLIGLLLYGLAVGLQPWVDGLLLAVIIMAFEIVLTGGLHLDGLADSFDGLFSYRSKERMLEIMKDSRIGSNGVLILIVSLLMKVAAISVLVASNQLLPLLWYPVLARCSSVFTAWISPYARKEGMGNFFIGRTSGMQWLLCCLQSALWVFIVQPGALICLLVVHLSAFGFTQFCRSKIDGMTGDTMGANTELQSLLLVVVSAMMVTLGGQGICAWFY